MKTTVTTITCDICSSSDIYEEALSLPVVFVTNQTDGHSTLPYLSSEKIDICRKCYNNILKGNLPFGSGAMGYNKYWFEEKK